ncbi:hypothetical protein T05_12867 [Trichinella murrelli]|uniref:Uncharacterized protein n=1 Tax=Trichinella murrelli TaxID=144512 RepID=A0A0V0STS9_9BILA|nr:hypothetical protein T05_12867 [Trichinella murrelli]
MKVLHYLLKPVSTHCIRDASPRSSTQLSENSTYILRHSREIPQQYVSEGLNGSNV